MDHPGEQPFDYRWQARLPPQSPLVPATSLHPGQPTSSALHGAPAHSHPSTSAPARSSCMERTWNKQTTPILPSNTYQQKFEPRLFDLRNFDQKVFEQAAGKSLLDPGTKVFLDQSGKLLFDADKHFVDDRESPNVDIIDPISHSATPSPLPQQPVSLHQSLQPSHQVPANVQFVTLPQNPPMAAGQLQAASQICGPHQVLLVIKDGQVVANSNQVVAIAPSQPQVQSLPQTQTQPQQLPPGQPQPQQPQSQPQQSLQHSSVDMEPLNIDTSLKEQELGLEEELSPSMILEHAEVDDEETDEEAERASGEEYQPDDDYHPGEHYRQLAADAKLDPQLPTQAVEDSAGVRRSGRRRRNATYSEEFQTDYLDLADDLESPGKNGAERKKRKSSKPVKVTPEAAEEWTEAEDVETETGGSRKNKKILKSGNPGSYSWKKTNVWFGEERMRRFQQLKGRAGLKTEGALINRMLSLMERSMSETERTPERQTTSPDKRAPPATNKTQKRAGRASVHQGEQVDEFGMVLAEHGQPETNVCLRVSPPVRHGWLDLLCQSRLPASAFLARLLLSYLAHNQLDATRYQSLAREAKMEATHEPLDICVCPPAESESEDRKRKKKKTKEVENIDDNDYIVHKTLDSNLSETRTNGKHSKFYECVVCHKVYRSFSFFYHLRTHKSHNFSCDKCGRQTPIRQPKRSKHATTCIYCDFQSHYKPILRNHYKEMHPLQCKPGQHYLCDICPKIFKSAATLRDHRYTHMEDNFKFQCEICQKYFANRRFLRVHLHGVHGNKSHICSEEGCNRAFNTKNMLNTHIKRVHLKVRRVTCPYGECAKMFFSKCELAQHTRVYHTKEKCFTCTWQNCGKTFRAPYHLQVHMRIHTDTKPLKCPHCDYRARQRNALNWHLRKHGEGPHFDKLSKPRPAGKSRKAASGQAAVLEAQADPRTAPPAAIDQHASEIQMYTPQFANFDFQNLQHHANPFHGMELYHPQMPAFPQAIPQSSTHAPMQYQTL